MATTMRPEDDWPCRLLVKGQSHALLFFLIGILFAIAGVLAIAAPLGSSLAVVLTIGWLLLIGGFFHLFQVARAGEGLAFIGSLLVGLLFIGVGILMLRQPLVGAEAMTLLLAVLLLLEGFVSIAFPLTLYPLAHGGWASASGLVGIVIAGIVYLQLPFDIAWILGLLFGVYMLVLGISMLVLPTAARAYPDLFGLQPSDWRTVDPATGQSRSP